MHRVAIPVTLAIFACTACNTISGVGKDVGLVGKVMTKTANDASRTKGACVPDNSRVPPRTCPSGTAKVRYAEMKPANSPPPLKTASSSGVSTAKPAQASASPVQPASDVHPAGAKAASGKTAWYDWP